MRMEIRIRTKIFFKVSCLCCVFFVFLYGCTSSENLKPIEKTEILAVTATKLSNATLIKSSTPAPTETPALPEQTEQAKEDYHLLAGSLIFECTYSLNRFDMPENEITQLVIEEGEERFSYLSWIEMISFIPKLQN